MKILFEIVADQSQAALQLAKLRGDIRTFRNELKKDGVGADRIKELNTEIGKSQLQVLKLTEAQKNLNREFKAAAVPKDSLAGLRIEYAKLTDQVAKLDKVSRESDFGKNLIKKTSGLKSQIDGIEQSLGRFTGNVGNYKSALLSVGDLVTGGLVTGGIAAAVGATIEVMKIGVKQAMKYEKALDDLSALTGLSGDALKGLQGLEQSLRTISINGVEIVNTGPDILNAMKLVGGAQPELLKNADALADVTKQAIILSQASGDDLEPSVKALTTVLGQFNLDGSESKRVINELAAGAKEGAAEIPDITDALQKFGTVAKISNITTSESVALIETLAERQLKGAEAGTQLRNVLSKLASADILPASAQEQFQKLGIDINVLKDSTLPLEKRLRELGKAQGDLSALTKIFGLENLQAATIITSGIDKYTDLNKAVQGTSEAYDQAATRADNLTTKVDNLKTKALNSLETSFTKAGSGGSILIGVLDFLVDDLNIVGVAMDVLSVAILGPIAGLGKLTEQFKSLFGIGKGKKIGLQGLDLEGLKSSVDLTTGGDVAPKQKTAGPFPVAKKDVDVLLAQAKALQETGDESEKSTKSIAELKAEIKSLNKELSSADPASESFKQLSIQLKAAKAELKEKQTDAGILNPKKIKKDADLVAGSLAFFDDQILKLKKELENTPEDSPLFKKLVSNIKTAETNVDLLKKKIEELKNPTVEAPPTESGLPPEFSSGEDITRIKSDKDERDRIVALNTFRAEKEVENAEFAASVAKDLADKKIGLAQDEQKAKDKIAEEDKKRDEDVRQAIKDAALDSAQAISDAIFEIQKNKADQEKEEKLTALDEETQKKIDAAHGNAALIAKIEKDADKKKAVIEKQAAERAKSIARTQAIINIALGVIKALSSAAPPYNFILAAATAVAGAFQLAAINNQKYARGGVVKNGQDQTLGGRPHSAGGTKGVFDDGTRVEMEKDELLVVINRRNAQALRRLSAINSAGGNGVSFASGDRSLNLLSKSQRAFLASPRTFAQGGFLDLSPQISAPGASGSSSSVVNVVSSFSDDQILKFARIVAAETSAQTGSAVANGIGDADRRNERLGILTQTRQQ